MWHFGADVRCWKGNTLLVFWSFSHLRARRSQRRDTILWTLILFLSLICTKMFEISISRDMNGTRRYMVAYHKSAQSPSGRHKPFLDLRHIMIYDTTYERATSKLETHFQQNLSGQKRSLWIQYY